MACCYWLQQPAVTNSRNAQTNTEQDGRCPRYARCVVDDDTDDEIASSNQHRMASSDFNAKVGNRGTVHTVFSK